MTGIADLRRDARRAVDRHRHLLVAALLATAVAAGISALSPRPAATVAVLAAARDLTGGAPLQAGDVVTTKLPPAAVPSGALRAGARVAGLTLAAPMRRGEPLTDVRLLGPSLLAALGRPGLVAVPVHVGDAAAVAHLRIGDVVDVLAGPDPATGREPDGPLASAAIVVAGPTTSSDRGSVLVIAASPEEARALSTADGRLTVALRGDR